MSFSQDELDALIHCPKRVSQPPRREMKVEGGHSRNDFRLESVDGQHQFQAFFRRNDRLPENFSLGLNYQAPDGKHFPLIRLNGPHGDSSFSFDPTHPHNETHIHQITAADLDAGILKPRQSRTTSEYASFEEAVGYFVRLINITGAADHFDRFLQLNLGLGDPEGEP